MSLDTKINQIPSNNSLNTTYFPQKNTLHQIVLTYLTYNVFNPKPFSGALNQDLNHYFYQSVKYCTAITQETIMTL